MLTATSSDFIKNIHLNITLLNMNENLMLKKNFVVESGIMNISISKTFLDIYQ